MAPTARAESKLMRRLDHAVAKVNPFLTVIAIGLAIITLTSSSVIAMKDALAPITRVGCPVVSLDAAHSVTVEVSRN